MERNARKVYRGVVTSDAMDKTITVVVETKKTHPLYGKRVKYSKKFKAHDENNEAHVGDRVVSWKLVHYQLQNVSVLLKSLKKRVYKRLGGRNNDSK